MKKISGLFAILILITVLYAEPINMFRFGGLATKDSRIGTMAGYCYGSRFDNTVTLFSSVDLFYRNYTKDKKIGYATNVADNPVVTMLRTSDITTYYVPLELNGQVNFPMERKKSLYFGGGFGFGLLWEEVFVAQFYETTSDPIIYHPGINETKFYRGFNWNLRAGARYQLSKHTAVFAEIFYNNGRMKRDLMVSSTGITWNEIDMSGVGLRVGVEVPRLK